MPERLTLHVCGRHLNKVMEKLIDAHPQENIANGAIGVLVKRNGRGGSVYCNDCGKRAPAWELEYTPL